MEYETEQPGDPKLVAEGIAANKKRELQRARITAVMFGAITSLSLIFIIYAFIQKGIAEENAKFANSLELKLQQCELEALKQKEIAQKAVEEIVKKQRALELATIEANRQRMMAIEANTKARK